MSCHGSRGSRSTVALPRQLSLSLSFFGEFDLELDLVDRIDAVSPAAATSIVPMDDVEVAGVADKLHDVVNAIAIRAEDSK